MNTRPTPQSVSRVGPTLESIYPPFRDKMAEYRKVAERDGRAAELIFAEAQEIAKAFWAGVNHAQEAAQ